MVVNERKDYAPASVYKRGDPSRKEEPFERHWLTILGGGGFPDDQSPRLSLAQKIADNELLYYGHEQQREEERWLQYILVDSSASMRGNADASSSVNVERSSRALSSVSPRDHHERSSTVTASSSSSGPRRSNIGAGSYQRRIGTFSPPHQAHSDICPPTCRTVGSRR